jgi:hypothetical protein
MHLNQFWNNKKHKVKQNKAEHNQVIHLRHLFLVLLLLRMKEHKEVNSIQVRTHSNSTMEYLTRGINRRDQSS